MTQGEIVVAIIVAFLGGVPPTIMAFATYIQNRGSAMLAKEAAALQRETAAVARAAEAASREAAVAAREAALLAKETAVIADKKTNELVVQSREIHTAVNSNLTALKAELERANGQNDALQKLVENMTAQLRAYVPLESKKKPGG